MRINTILVITLAVLLSVQVGVAQRGRGRQAAQQGSLDAYKPHTYKGMPYRLMSPINFDSKKKYPVILSLHGAGGKGNDNRKQLKDWNFQLADTKVRTDYPCYLVAPQAEGMWNKEHLDNCKEIIRGLESVDMKMIYILGHSMGGEGTYRLIQMDPGYFAAAAPSAGSGLRRGESFIDVSLIKDVPIWAFHGEKDGVCPLAKDQKVFDEMKKIGGKMKFTIWKGEKHSVSGKFVVSADDGTTQLSSKACDPEPVFLKWLFAQTR
ncbi:MAG: dienelactone hydrolase family protein [Kiritimatiellia bacterium]|jgi:predicted peptidase|nr:dienelactone hydrolase family protein [Kiritimatiellia bacterium]